MKVYTRKGDQGTTSLIGGTKVSKSDIKIESYGTIDELNSWLGVVKDSSHQKKWIDFIDQIQNQLFNIASLLAEDKSVNKMKLPEIHEDDVKDLENSIDELDEVLPPLKNFVIPGGHLSNSFTHVARCVCRRAERCVVELSKVEEVNPIIIQYLNRLSDWLFVYARYMSFANQAKESLWKPSIRR